MAYNNYFPVNYVNPYQNQMQAYQAQQNQSAMQTQQAGIIWVQGEAGAKSYLVAPNNTVQLWDSEAQVIYLKSADASGMPSMKILDYSIRNDSMAPTNAFQTGGSTDIQYATKDVVDALRAEIDNLKADIEKLNARRRRVKEDVDNE